MVILERILVVFEIASRLAKAGIKKSAFIIKSFVPKNSFHFYSFRIRVENPF